MRIAPAVTHCKVLHNNNARPLPATQLEPSQPTVGLKSKKLRRATSKKNWSTSSRTICAVAEDVRPLIWRKARYRLCGTLVSNWNVPKVAATFDLAIGRGPSMPRIIDILLGEHQASKKLLLVLACRGRFYDESGRLRKPAQP
jgi:hypothetical protein